MISNTSKGSCPMVTAAAGSCVLWRAASPQPQTPGPAWPRTDTHSELRQPGSLHQISPSLPRISSVTGLAWGNRTSKLTAA